MSNEQQTSGLEKLPKVLSRPIHKDRFFWIGVATAVFWVVLFWYLLR